MSTGDLPSSTPPASPSAVTSRILDVPSAPAVRAFRFDAFVSYRRGDGAKAARWLRGWLRGYRLPKSVRAALPKDQAVREPLSVFLDTEYSRAVPDYYDRNILPALQQAEFLLVIASPQALLPGADGGTNWVEREVGDFLSTTQRENIIAVATPDFAGDAGAVTRLPGQLLEHFPRLQIVLLRTLSWWRFIWWPWTWQMRDAALTCVAALHHIPSELMPLLRQEEERLRRKRLGWVAASACALLLVLTLLGGWALVAERQKVAALEDVLRISDIRKLGELNERAEAQLWPIHPAKRPDISAWLVEARTLSARLPEHEATLGAIDQRRGLNEAERAWWRANLQELTSGLRTLQGFAQPNVPSVGLLTQRDEQIARLEKVTLVDTAAAWTQARTGIAAHPAYRGLEIPVQFGLVPLEPDPQSGLWEFWHPLSGERPQRHPHTGRWIMKGETGLVLVLVPGGKFRMGSPADEPGAAPNEKPAHDVEVGPFFLSKYEMTQGQWKRFTNLNRAYFRAGRVADRRSITEAHPMENISWEDATRTLWQMGLRLPTEAQWEYAARAGTTTRWFTGDDPESLTGFVNLLDQFAKGSTEITTNEHAEPWLNDGHGYHAPVGTYAANPFGLHDMLGNVMEWCCDMSSGYVSQVRPVTGERLGPPWALRIMRGGGFSQIAVAARCTRRYESQPDFHGNYVGVRPAHFITQPGDPPRKWEDAADLTRREAWQHFDQGKSLGESRDYVGAIREFEAAARLVPDFLDARMNRGVALVLSDRRPEALIEFQTIVELKPEHADNRAKLAQLLAEAGRTAEAIPHYRQAFASYAAPYPELTRLLMEALVKEKRLPEAIEAAEAHLKKSEPDAGFCYRYGWVLRESGRLPEAIRWFEKSIAYQPSPRRHADLASTLAAHQQPDEARRHYLAAIALAPREASIHQEFLAFLSAQHDEAAARDEEARWQKASLDPASPR